MNTRAIVVLIGHHARLSWRPLVPMAFALGLFQFVLAQLAPAPNEVSWISGMLALVPPQLKALAGGEAAMVSTDGFLALGYAHPFFLLLMSAWAVRLSTAPLAGEIGRGTMDLIASRAVNRSDHLVASVCALALGLATLAGAALAGSATGLSVRPLGVSGWSLAHVALAAWMLFMCWGAVGLAVSALHRESGPAIGWTAGFIAVSFVVEYLARLWRPIAWLRPVSLFTYYQPPEIVRLGLWAAHPVVLGAVLCAAIGTAYAIFVRRDL